MLDWLDTWLMKIPPRGFFGVYVNLGYPAGWIRRRLWR